MFAEVIEGVVSGLVGSVSAVEKEIGMAAIASDLWGEEFDMNRKAEASQGELLTAF